MELEHHGELVARLQWIREADGLAAPAGPPRRKIRTVAPEAVPDEGVLEVPAAWSYLIKIDGEVRALSRKGTHLGCGVPFCESSGQFECPCHGSAFNRAGELRGSPSPRGMDQHPIEVGADGLIYIDTGTTENGPAPGAETIDEPVRGPACAE